MRRSRSLFLEEICVCRQLTVAKVGAKVSQMKLCHSREHDEGVIHECSQSVLEK